MSCTVTQEGLCFSTTKWIIMCHVSSNTKIIYKLKALNFSIRAMKIQVKMIRMDNTGENKLIQKSLEQEEFNVNFQYTAASMPQQNGHVEQKFATLYSKVRSSLNLARITKGLCCKLWAKCAAHVTSMENVIVKKANDSSLFEKSMVKRCASLSILGYLAKWASFECMKSKLRQK